VRANCDQTTACRASGSIVIPTGPAGTYQRPLSADLSGVRAPSISTTASIPRQVTSSDARAGSTAAARGRMH
jgi:hypothetical protein